MQPSATNRYDRRPLILALILFTLAGAAYLTSNAAPDWVRPPSRDAWYSAHNPIPVTLSTLIDDHAKKYGVVRRTYDGRWLVVGAPGDQIRAVAADGVSLTFDAPAQGATVRATFDDSQQPRVASLKRSSFFRVRCKARISPLSIELVNCALVDEAELPGR